MLICDCIQKNKDKNGNIVSYVLKSPKGDIKEFGATELKHLMYYLKIGVRNLTLTSDKRLVDRDGGTCEYVPYQKILGTGYNCDMRMVFLNTKYRTLHMINPERLREKAFKGEANPDCFIIPDYKLGMEVFSNLTYDEYSSYHMCSFIDDYNKAVTGEFFNYETVYNTEVALVKYLHSNLNNNGGTLRNIPGVKLVMTTQDWVIDITGYLRNKGILTNNTLFGLDIKISKREGYCGAFSKIWLYELKNKQGGTLILYRNLESIRDYSCDKVIFTYDPYVSKIKILFVADIGSYRICSERELNTLVAIHSYAESEQGNLDKAKISNLCKYSNLPKPRKNVEDTKIIDILKQTPSNNTPVNFFDFKSIAEMRLDYTTRYPVDKLHELIHTYNSKINLLRISDSSIPKLNFSLQSDNTVKITSIETTAEHLKITIPEWVWELGVSAIPEHLKSVDIKFSRPLLERTIIQSFSYDTHYLINSLTLRNLSLKLTEPDFLVRHLGQLENVYFEDLHDPESLDIENNFSEIFYDCEKLKPENVHIIK